MDVMLIFDIILVVFGLYMVGAALLMRKKGRISSVMLTPEEITKCKNSDGFIAYMYGREIIFGGIVAVMGVLGLLNDLVLELSFYNVIEMLLFLGVFLWFQGELSKARANFV